GIGLETVKQLAENGVKVIAASRNKERGEAAVASLVKDGLDVEFLQLDVVNEADIHNAYQYISNNYGKLDILINNAGIQVESDSDWAINTSVNVNEKALRETFETNFFAIIKLTDELLPLLKKSDAGRIVNLSSILGSLTLHADENSPIYGSKLRSE
ncbi:SDR family NAD(P)-dependent oxidoreductase, partial [Thermococcus sp. M36]|uniref:SDR family NAD(P)-dependent oxidoreductase n=1 Tax=Thermococcus sp. M36 TaxID=1638261 RepID=UPI00143BCF43